MRLACRLAALCLLLFTGAALLVAPARAQGAGLADRTRALTQYKIDGWQTEQGLPINTVQSLLQTRDGYLWVGTAGGLLRFDGVRFTNFEDADAPAPGSRPIFGLMEDAQGRLWIGHHKGAVVYVNGRFETVIGPELAGGRRVWSFAQAPDGAVWAATENGLVRWDSGATRLYQQADGLPSNRLRSLAFDRAGTLWIATTGGGLVSLADGRFQTLTPEQGFPHLQVRSVLADPEGGVWAATAGGGLAHVGAAGAIKVYGVADGLPTDQLTSLARDAQGTLWIGTWGAGIVRMSGGRFSSLSSAGGLAGEQIWTVQTDREGSIWVGTWTGGLNRLRSRAFAVLGAPEGLSHNNTRSVLHARNGVTWVATSGGGLNRIAGAHITHLGKKDGLPTDEIAGLHEDHEASIWIGTYTAGVARLRQGRIERYGLAQGLPNAEVRVLFEDSRGRLWAGTQAGLALFNGRGFAAVRDAGAPRGGVASILEDRRGTLWFGTTGDGLVRLRDGRFETLTREDGLVSNWIMALYEDADANLWIGTNGEGINRLRDGKLASIRAADGLWDGIALSLHEDRHGYLWASCNRGFFRFARADLNAFAEGRLKKVESTGYGPGDALRSTTFAGGLQPAGAVDAQGQIWLPSANGLVIIDPLHLPGPVEPPRARLEGVSINGVNQPPDAAVLLPPGSAPLSIRYTAMTLLNAERVRFRYQLDGLTPDWVDAGVGRQASFPALPHGRYRFRVAASNDGQRWSEASEVLDITVAPLFYQTHWFIALVLLGAVAVVLASFQWRTHSLRARHAAMERLVAQRTEELRQANERLSHLSFVDALTGLPNRRCFDEALDTEWRRARRSRTPLAVVMADIDGFKAYNDLRGHPEGDRCLAKVATAFLQAVSRAGDLAARYGGEEFVVLIPGADHAAAQLVAENIRAACEALAITHPAAPVGAVITLSLGVASCVPAEDSVPASLLAEADAALYRAKQEGRNRVC